MNIWLFLVARYEYEYEGSMNNGKSAANIERNVMKCL